MLIINKSDKTDDQVVLFRWFDLSFPELLAKKLILLQGQGDLSFASKVIHFYIILTSSFYQFKRLSNLILLWKFFLELFKGEETETQRAAQFKKK